MSSVAEGRQKCAWILFKVPGLLCFVLKMPKQRNLLRGVLVQESLVLRPLIVSIGGCLIFG